ncbi:MAG: hypothetical protein LUC93_11135 [Planctomycetaceae bacterium]|nr:hypothetical protein [Planctomycetaceae bacterium]
MDHQPPVPAGIPLPDEALPTHDHGDLSPYAGFSLPEGGVEPVPQRRALEADPEIAGYLHDTGHAPWTRKRYITALTGLAVTAALLVVVYIVAPGSLFSRYRPPAPQDTPKPQPYPNLPSVPILYRETVRSINADLESGTRYGAAFATLQTLIDDDGADAIRPPVEVGIWAREEMLVLLASREVPPDRYTEAYADEVYASLIRLAAERPDTAYPFRGGAAYARVLASRPLPKDAGEARVERERTAALIETLRAENPAATDNNRDLLVAEAETHIALLPDEYISGDRRLDYHWRRAAYAIGRLYTVFGQSDPVIRTLDHRRWEAVYRYFDYTLFTLDTSRIGRIESARLDGVDYTRADIRAKMEELQ